ncbi:hypothetical protein RE680_00375 [Serratia marcescens]|nr:hypothetical protein RE680_00375 [Serratia marcescens]
MHQIMGIIKFLWLYIALFFIFSCVIYYFEIDYSFGDYNAYATVLIGVSGMVFTIMGIWIAFIYPNALQRIVNPKTLEVADFSQGLEDTQRLEAIVGSVLKSAVVIVSLMMIFLLKLVLFKTDIYLSNKELVKLLSLSMIIVLSYAQIEAVYQVIKANILFIEDLHNKREQREIDDDI